MAKVNPHASLFVAKAMEARRKAYFDFILKKRKSWFAADGSYLPGVENDRRISFWILPALLSTDDPEGRAWACRFIMGETECWNDYNIFVSSSVASNLVHCRKQMTPDLIRRSEEHLDRFTIVEGGRKP